MREPAYIIDDLYGSRVWVLVGANIKDVEGHLRDLAPGYVSDGCDEWRGCMWELLPEDGAMDKTYLVALKSLDLTKPEDVGVLVHEMFHVTAALFRNVGLKLNRGSEEAFTYFHEWLVVETMKRYEPRTTAKTH